MVVALASPPTSGNARRALDGETDAWGDLFRRYERRVVVALLAHGLSLDESKDAAQDAWIHLLEHARAGRLARIELPGLAVRQALFFHASKRQTEHRRGELNRLLVTPSDDVGPEPKFLSREKEQQIRQLLQGESELNQKIFELAYSEHLTHEEIAKRLRRSTQRVRQILCEVRARLRQSFEESP